MKKPQRMCVSCKKRFEKSELIRISKLNDRPVVDNEKKQTSRGIYVCNDKKCIELLKKNKAIERYLNASLDEVFHQELKFIIEEKNFD